jgi:hypothetical protein
MPSVLASSSMDVDSANGDSIVGHRGSGSKMTLKTRYPRKFFLRFLIAFSFRPVKVVEPFYTGGRVSQAEDGTLATTLGEHVLLSHSSYSLRISGV